jgi:RNA polymerase sigma-70 factor (ECF subfamily)
MVKGLAGDAAAYRALLTALGGYLRAYFARRLGPGGAADAEDLVQETLMAVHTHRATYDPGRPFTAWLHAIARYKLIDHIRRRRLRRTIPVEDMESLFGEDDSEAAAARVDVERLLGSLPEPSASLVRKVKLEGRSIAATAAETGLSPSAVKVGVHRSIRALTLRLQRKGGP